MRPQPWRSRLTSSATDAALVVRRGDSRARAHVFMPTLLNQPGTYACR
jgi:hypothetical protein